MKIEEQVRGIVEEAINNENFRLDSVVYEKEGNSYFLRLVIDKLKYSIL